MLYKQDYNVVVLLSVFISLQRNQTIISKSLKMFVSDRLMIGNVKCMCNARS